MTQEQIKNLERHTAVHNRRIREEITRLQALRRLINRQENISEFTHSETLDNLEGLVWAIQNSDSIGKITEFLKGKIEYYRYKLIFDN